MKKTRFSEEQMVKILREADKSPVAEVAKKHGVSDVTIYAWRKRFGELEAVDVKRLALFRLADIQDTLAGSDFSQAETLQLLPDENAVQKWVADRLDLLKGTSYSVERESRVIDEKEPDVRLRAQHSHATLPIEIKLTDRMSLAELEAALVSQLCGKYLRAADTRYGVLLIVHRKARADGWRLEPGTYWDFAQLIAHLKRLAADIAGKDPASPQPEIAVLDVSAMRPTATPAASVSRSQSSPG